MRRKHLWQCALLCALLSPLSSSAEEISLRDGTTLHFASVEQGRKILAAKDDFIQRLSPFDRSARMKTDRVVSEEEFLTFVGRSVVAWTETEKQTVETAIKKLQPLLRALPLSLPDTIEFVRTTGAEEGNAAYTRANAIVLPPAELAKSERDLQRLICHELFHILSRRNPPLREEMYAAIGFVKCDEIEFPAALRARKITNPDAPRNDHFIRLENAGATCLAVPILFAATESYDVQRGGEFFDYLSFEFLVVSHAADSHRVASVTENSAPKLLRPQVVTRFYEQIGRNTQYIIHPEEILADNFALLILGGENVPSPEILQKMRAILAQSPKPSRVSSAPNP